LKKFAAILFCGLLLLGQFASATAISVACKPAVTADCGAACQDMPCCAARPASSPKPESAAPVPASTQNEVSLPALAIILWTLPNAETQFSSHHSLSALTADGAPLYERNCALLI